MAKQSKVGEIMMSAVVTVHVGQSARQVRHLMQKHGIHALPVIGNEGELLGIVTSSDLTPEHDPDSLVARFMTTEVHTVRPDTKIEKAARLMRENGMHHLVVVDEGRMVGMLSTFDLLSVIERSNIPKRRSMVPVDARQ